jgi:hypothetical protein
MESKSTEQKKTPEIVHRILEPIIKIEYGSREEFIEKCPCKLLTNPQENTTIVPQGDFRLYEGKSFVSEGFVQCSGVVLESGRALGMMHLDSLDKWYRHLKKIEKYFAGESTKIILAKGDFEQRARHIYGYLKEKGVPIAESIVLDIPSKLPSWDMAYDPEKSRVYVHVTPDGVHTFFEYDIGPKLYSEKAHEESKEFFESRDYMPTGFREMEKYFTGLGYKIDEARFEQYGRDARKTVREELRFTEKDKIFVWTPKSGLVEKFPKEADLVGAILLPEWDPFNTLIFVATDYPVEISKTQFKGFVYGFTPDPAKAVMYYDFENILSKQEIRRRCEESKEKKV